MLRSASVKKPGVRDNACSFRESRQRGDVPAGVVIDHLDAVATRMRYENAAALRIEGTMIERAARRGWYLDYADRLQRHDHLDCFNRIGEYHTAVTVRVLENPDCTSEQVRDRLTLGVGRVLIAKRTG